VIDEHFKAVERAQVVEKLHRQLFLLVSCSCSYDAPAIHGRSGSCENRLQEYWQSQALTDARSAPLDPFEESMIGVFLRPQGVSQRMK
jgi:hypothetical protein